MGIPVGFDFKRTSPKPIDSSMVLTKAEMMAIDENTMPDNYFAVCKDDGNFYIYDKAMEPTPDTGKFRLLGGDGVGTLDEVLANGNESTDKSMLLKNSTDNGTTEIDSYGVTQTYDDGAGLGNFAQLGGGTLTMSENNTTDSNSAFFGPKHINVSSVDADGNPLNHFSMEWSDVASVDMSDGLRQAMRDELNIADKNYTTTEKKVGTYLGKDLYEITLTNININAAPSSGQVTWYDLTANKGIQSGWDIVDYEVLSRIADNISSATRSVMGGIIVRGGGNGSWQVGNQYQSNLYVRGLTLRYVKEAV